MWRDANPERTDEVFVVHIRSRHTFWTRRIARREGNGSITLFFRMYVLCACKKGTEITDTHKNITFMATRMWHLDSTSLVVRGGLNMMARVKCSSEQGFLSSASESPM